MPERFLFRAALLAAVVLVPTTTAQADTAMTGGATMQGTVDLAAGSWSGLVTGSLAGTHTDASGEDVTWALIMAAPARATLHWTDPVGVGPCVAGAAYGELRVRGGIGEAWGMYDKEGPLPRAIGGLEATARVEWRWTGTAGVLFLSDLVVQVNVYGQGMVTVVDGSETISLGSAPATFDCTDGSLDAVVTGLSLS